MPAYKKHLVIEWSKVCQIPQCLHPEGRRVGNGAHLCLGEGVLKQRDKCQAGSWALCQDICLWSRAGGLSGRVASVIATCQGQDVTYGL